MSRKRASLSRSGTALAVLGLVAICAAVLAAPAGAAESIGNAEIITADHDRGRTLSGQGGKLLSASGSSVENGKLTVPAVQYDPSTGIVSETGNLRFRKGKRGVALTGIEIDLAARTLKGKLAGTPMTVFRLSGEPVLDTAAGTATLTESVLRLTPDAAKIVGKKLGLKRALRHNGVGMVWINVRALPTHETRAISAGSVDWGFRASWRSYVLDVPPAGSVEVLDGATATGPLTSSATAYGFPATGGSFAKGLYGAGDRLALSTIGAVKWAKPGHGINEVRLSDIEIELNGSESWLVADVRTEIGPPAESKDVRVAALDPSAVTPTYSTDGNAVTWSEVPATLTEAGATSFAGFYEAGEALDPVTIAVGLG
jgi:hypothetical protein